MDCICSTPFIAQLRYCREIARAVTVVGMFLVMHEMQSVSASSSSQNTVFDCRLASSMPFISNSVSAAVIADSRVMSPIRCSMLCSTQVGCIAFYYSQSLNRCRLLKDVVLPAVEDDALYIIISGGVNSINIALYKPATASSIWLDYVASNAVDGKLGTIMHTACNTTYPWLMVDLQYIYSVTEVTVYTSCHCCVNRMHDIDIRVSNTSTPVAAFFDGTLCHHRIGNFTTCSPGGTYSCATGVVGRYLTVQVTVSASDHCFSPSEVVVKGELATQ